MLMNRRRMWLDQWQSLGIGMLPGLDWVAAYQLNHTSPMTYTIRPVCSLPTSPFLAQLRRGGGGGGGALLGSFIVGAWCKDTGQA